MQTGVDVAVEFWIQSITSINEITNDFEVHFTILQPHSLIVKLLISFTFQSSNLLTISWFFIPRHPKSSSKLFIPLLISTSPSREICYVNAKLLNSLLFVRQTANWCIYCRIDCQKGLAIKKHKKSICTKLRGH